MSGISLGRVTTLLLIGRAAGYVLALANSVILARVLGVERLGAYAYAMGVAAIFGLLPNLGISTVVTRTIAQGPDAGAGVLRAAVRAQALLAGGVLIAIPAFAAILPGQPVPVGYVALAAAQLAVGTLSWPYLAVLSGRARYDWVAVVELAAGVAGTSSLLAAGALHGGVAAFLWAHVLAAGVAVVVARRAAIPFLPTGAAQHLGIRALLRQAAPFGATAAVQSLYTRLDFLLLGQMASTAALGLYSAAYKPANLAVYLGGTVAGPLFPLMAQGRDPGAPVTFRRAMRGLGAAAPAMALTFSGLAGPLLRVLYGAEFAVAAPILVLLAWSAAANWLYAPLGAALQARGQELWWLASLGGGLALNAAGNLWAIPLWGAVGAAAATLASEAALVGLGAFLMSRKLGILPPVRPVLVGLGATAAGGAVLWMLGDVGSVPATLVALLVYGGFLILFRIITVEDAAIVVRWVRQAAPGWSRG
ncbi:MAG: oligosaccharide flippase family protein [candidate division NC10 bacterium]|nr:oligosaccharide flippase family protein [candidate division NC10 bacterium]